MSGFVPTPSQKNAIDARDSAILVSAGAGSGKTKVLTERLMGYITDSAHPADLDSFVIITFTKAAAAELKSRISDEISSALAADPSNRRLRRQSALVDRTAIGTIHSFCARLLRENCHYLSLAPDFKIVDDDRADAMKATALERVLDEHYKNTDKYPGFVLLADTVGAGRDDRRLAQLVLELHGKMQSHARPSVWAKEQVEMLSEQYSDIAATVWGQEIMSRAKAVSEYWTVQLDALMNEMHGDMKVEAGYMPSVSHTADAVRELDRSLRISWDKAREAMPIPFDRLGAVRGANDPVLQQRIKDRRDDCKAAMKKLEELFYSPSDKLLAEMKTTAPAMKALLELTLAFDKAYSKDKLRAGMLDYADLEHMTASLLTNEDGSANELSRSLAKRYTEIMVDEYQDVSRVQDTIFRAISKDGTNLFMVGDVKQAIYRFRLADPQIFTEKYLSYGDYDAADADKPHRIMLRENFRSRREVIDGANKVFSLCMSRQMGEIDYDENAKLICGAKYEGNAPKPKLLMLAHGKSDDLDAPGSAEAEARMVGGRILELIASSAPVTDRDGMRPMRYGDIAILMRSANSVGQVYSRVLSEMGIPVSHGQSGDFFNSVEVSTVISMLAVIDNPHQDIPLIAVLRSPAFGFTADELTNIRTANRRGDFYTALCDRAADNDKAGAFLEKLSALRSISADMSVSQLTWKLLGDMDMLSICSAMTDGDTRRANLMELLELAEKYQATGYHGLHRYVLWLRRLMEKGRDTGGDEGGNAVKIMTVHKSKGLEFPVVFLCDTARRFNKTDNADTVLVHPQLGLGPKVTDLQRRIEYPTLARLAIKLRNESELLSEEMRLLYVALTRPKEYLFITAAVSDPEKYIDKHRSGLSSPMDPQVLAAAQSYLDWLTYAVLADNGETLELETVDGTKSEKSVTVEIDTPEADASELAELERRLAFTYPYTSSVSLPSKVTATELKGYENTDEDAESILKVRHRPFRLPDFQRENKPLTGTERGNAAHLVLQFMDFEKTGSVEAIKGEIERLRAQNFITERQSTAVDANAVYKLFASPLGRRMLKADKTVREFKFSILCDASEVFGRSNGEQVLLQGVVDCCIEEKGILTVIDYKTDNVRTEEDISSRAEHYAPQLKAYAKALERIFKKPVGGCVLYFINAGKSVSVKE